ncbi:MAG: pseudaminic acid cytidylyltransferase [Verrucomicrobia bacterium]|nr:pseudaminic acid cytidylyltransferase [Verrucomicrobiota bacterium]
MNAAIIPARAGSKRIPKKNIREFAGLPMIAHSIKTARVSGLFSTIIVSTDSDEIAKVAKRYGADVPFNRPAALADDRTGTDDVFLHALQFLSEQASSPAFACCIYATAPFLRAEHLEQGLDILEANGASSAVAVTSFPFPVLRAQRIDDAGRLVMQWPEHRMTRSQDLPEFYHDAGQFYWTRVDRYLKNPNVYHDAAPVIIPRYLVHDIDSEEDWTRAELMYKTLQHF